MDATVLLVMDVQRGIVERVAEDPGYLHAWPARSPPPAARASRWCM
jgi:hypothetical protein